MQDQTWFNLVAGVAATLVVVVGIASLVFAPGGAVMPRTNGTGPTNPTVYRNLTIFYNPTVRDYVYSTSELNVPTGTQVVFSITNYDPSASRLPSPMYDQVIGTRNGDMTVSTAAGSVITSSLPLSEVSHTFTVWSGSYHLNVPIPAAGGAASPVRVTFSATFNLPGSFTFGCVAYCAGSGMAANSGMFGTLSVS
jgi:plastocyanin